MIVQLIDFLRQRLKIVTYCFYGLIVMILVWSFSVDTSHAHTWAEKYIPGFWSLFGLISCGAVIVTARWFGKSGILTREDYYDN